MIDGDFNLQKLEKNNNKILNEETKEQTENGFNEQDQTKLSMNLHN